MKQIKILFLKTIKYIYTGFTHEYILVASNTYFKSIHTMKKLVNYFVLLPAIGLFLSCAKDLPQVNTSTEAQSDALVKSENAKNGTTLKEGIIKYSAGHYLAGTPIPVGFDAFGYNYQARMFKGSYANAYLGGIGYPPYDGNDVEYLKKNPNAKVHWAWPYRNVKLEMKWNDAWISNMDRDGNGTLDRHYGFTKYIGSGAWITNHMSESYIDNNGKKAIWVDFVKIVAVPQDAYKKTGIWYTADGVEIGADIWGEFATIQEIYNEQGSSYHGKLYLSPDHAGFGGW
ncbi:MAG: hypothetical protein ACD_77C00021G0001 [uncultured bacterium]|nr:MAG: hypothetical protein ACD_77C00021G0001 [uncultured bacterium]